MGQLMMILDATIVAVALPAIKTDLHFSSSSLTWVMNAYLIAFGSFLLLGGRLGDLIGRTRMFLVGITIFSRASALRRRPRRSWPSSSSSSPTCASARGRCPRTPSSASRAARSA
jgi:MFS family permease